jgi:ligand-binding sensor domain-containing protein/signal transduction histidine kinase
VRSVGIFSLLAVSGWALDASRALTQYQHRIWQTQQGLPAAAIRSIEQTADGYLWLGMDRGLVRFDGVRFNTPGELIATPLVSAHIRQVTEDRQRNLWIATNGAGLFRLHASELARFSTQNGLASNAVSCVFEDRAGTIWACTDRGMARIVNDQIETLSAETSFQAACQSRDGTLWAGGKGNQLSLWDSAGPGGPVPAARQMMLRTLPSFATVQALLCAADGSVWAGSTEGVTRIENGKEKTVTKEAGLADNSVLSFDEAPDGTIWIGTNDGFSRLRNGEFQSYGAKDGLSQSAVFSVYQDRDGSLWVGTKRGLNQFLDRRAIPITTSEGLPSNDTGPVLQDGAGQLWVGSLGAGLARFDGRRWSVIGRAEGLSSNNISALAQGAAGALWVGSDWGLDLLVQGREKQSYSRRDGLPSNSIRSLFLDREGTLWIGTASGAAVLRNGQIERLTGAAGRRSPVLAFAEDDGGHVYSGVEDTGVSTYDEGSLREIPRQRLAIRNVDALESTGKVLWVGTIGGGLTMVEDGRAVNLTEDDGLYDNDIYGIVPDERGHLWMACSKGIFSVNRAELEKFRSGELKEVASATYSPMDGLQTLEGRSGVQPALWRMRDGHLCFSMIRGLIVIDPDQFAVKMPVPQVSVESVTVDGRRMAAESLGQMHPGTKNLFFSYTGLSFRSPQRMTFRYILEGFDKRWTEANTRRQAFYTNLPPGQYRFRVTACNFDGTCNEAGASVSFLIPAPFYQRVWFIAACVLMAALAAVLAYRTRIEGIKRQFEAILGERNRIARELHDTLLQGFSGVTMQMQALAGRLGAPERSLLEEIIRDAAHCLTEARRSVADLRGRQTGDSGLSSEIERLAHQVAASSGFKLKLHVDHVPPMLPAGVEYNLVRIAQEALANAVKHSRGQSIKLSLRHKRNALGLSIVDDGLGFEPGGGSNSFPGHYGLIGMRERARDIGAALTIESSRGGTAVRVTVPLSGRLEAQPAGATGD